MISKLAMAFLFSTLSLTAAGQGKPDLIVASLVVEPNTSGYSGRVSVTVTNPCRGSGAPPSFLLVTFKESEQPGAKSIYFVGSKVKALKGGETQTLTFDASASGKQIELTRYVIAEVDPYRKVAEVNEGNNWRTLNPAAAEPPGCR
jgi:hypothetical protein